MSTIRTDWDLGLLPLQHLTYERLGQNLTQDHRHVLFGARTKRRDTDDDRLGEFEIVEESGGDIMGFHLWMPEEEGVGDPKRFTSGWATAWPVSTQTDPARLGNRLNRTVDDPIPTGLPSDLTFGYPIKDISYDADFRWAKEIITMPNLECWSRPPGRSVGIILSGTQEQEQVPLFFHTDPRTIAVNHAGDVKCGTLCADLNEKSEIDPTRCGIYQSHWWVIKKPTAICVDFKGKNSIAWNIGPSGLGDVHGGIVVDLEHLDGETLIGFEAALETFASTTLPSSPGGTGPIGPAPSGAGGGAAGAPAAGAGAGQNIPVAPTSTSASQSGAGGSPAGPSPVGPTSGSPSVGGAGVDPSIFDPTASANIWNDDTLAALAAQLIYDGQLDPSALDPNGPPPSSSVSRIELFSPFFLIRLGGLTGRTPYYSLSMEYYRIEPTMSDLLSSLSPIQAVEIISSFPGLFGITPPSRQSSLIVTSAPGDSVSVAPSVLSGLVINPSPSPAENPPPSPTTRVLFPSSSSGPPVFGVGF